MYRRALILGATVMALGLGAGTVALAGNGPLPGDLAQVRGALARYTSLAQAERDGYVADGPCAESPGGAMGIHYLNRSLLGGRSAPASCSTSRTSAAT